MCCQASSWVGNSYLQTLPMQHWFTLLATMLSWRTQCLQVRGQANPQEVPCTPQHESVWQSPTPVEDREEGVEEELQQGVGQVYEEQGEPGQESCIMVRWSWHRPPSQGVLLSLSGPPSSAPTSSSAGATCLDMAVKPAMLRTEGQGGDIQIRRQLETGAWHV